MRLSRITRVNTHPNYISHHGIKGQHWGIRRYQNEDGTYTAEGKARRSGYEKQMVSRILKDEFGKPENRKFLKKALGITSKEEFENRLHMERSYSWHNKKTGEKATTYTFRLRPDASDKNRTLDQRANIDQTEYIVDYDHDNKKVLSCMFNWI